jgi:DNA-binding NarL/FixJ family response regulator
MQPKPTRILLATSDHQGWTAVRTTMQARQDKYLVDEAPRARAVGPVVTAAHAQPPDAILLAADRPGAPLGILARDLCVASPASKILVIGPSEALDGDTLVALMELGVPGYLTWEDIRPPVLPRCIAAVLSGNVLVASPSVLAALHAALERRRGPRVESLLLAPRERGDVQGRTMEQPAPLVRAALWEQNPDLTALLQTLCARAGIALTVVSAADTMRAAAAGATPDDLLIIDCAWALPGDMARCTAIIAETTASVYLIHPRKEVVDTLAPLARGPLTWLPPDFAALTLLDMLRLRTAISAVAESPIAHMPLSAREHEVLRLVAQRYHDAQIAAFLCISEGTVKTNVARIKKKAGLSTREELIAAYPRLTRQEHTVDKALSEKTPEKVDSLCHPKGLSVGLK